ncbi:hypothetical protein ELI_0595 [Eubacterium callanderi]|uniref:Uncharacterized protein n=1 Tax=Eubacterium callanderi TaxID=53442 RepID=E3GIX6_9FIRM|nr:hypothetical protein ELI_0595 [Eubacterium callanderi]
MILGVYGGFAAMSDSPLKLIILSILSFFPIKNNTVRYTKK